MGEEKVWEPVLEVVSWEHRASGSSWVPLAATGSVRSLAFPA